MSICTACEEGRHHDCGMQTWCECPCCPDLMIDEDDGIQLAQGADEEHDDDRMEPGEFSDSDDSEGESDDDGNAQH